MYSVPVPSIATQPAPSKLHQQPRNARFWVFWNQTPIKLTLASGQKLSVCDFQIFGEGCTRLSASWEHTGEAIHKELFDEGFDCDGRISSSSSFFCPLSELASRKSDFCEDLLPNWIHLESEQRDFTAETSGY